LKHKRKATPINMDSKIELLQFILLCIGIIRDRFEPIKNREDFLRDSESFMRLDAIAMRLFRIADAMKRIYEIDSKGLSSIADDDHLIRIISIRELFINSSIELDSGVIFNICNNRLDDIEESILNYLNVLTKKE